MQVLKKIVKYIKKNIHNFLVNKVDFFLMRFFYFFNRVFVRKKTYSKKNIMVLIYHLRNGGAERVASNLCDELSKKYNVILVTCEEKNDSDYSCGVERIVVDEMRAKYFKLFDTVSQIKNIKKKYHITHTISFTAQMNYLNVMSRVRDTTIISIRNYISLAENDNTPKNIYMNRLSIKYADKITVVSKVLGKDLINNFGAKEDKIYSIYNFVDKDKMDKFLKEKDNIKLSRNTVITVGRLNNQKGHINLIRSFKYVVDKIGDARLIILGQGPLEDKIKNEIKKLRLEKNVELLGYEKNPYLYMKNSSLFVLSSFYEGMPNVILEAMYCGLPIISTDCKSGPREIIASTSDLNCEIDKVSLDEYGILVPVLKDKSCEKIMGDAIIKMLKDSKLRDNYSRKSKKRIKDFSKDKMIDNWNKVLD